MVQSNNTFIKQSMRFAFVGFVGMFAVSCAGQGLYDRASSIDPDYIQTGANAEYSRTLHQGYLDLSGRALQRGNILLSDFYAQRAITAAEGGLVEPVLASTDPILSGAYQRVSNVIRGNALGIDQASALVNYDCWARESQEGDSALSEICQRATLATLASLGASGSTFASNTSGSSHSATATTGAATTHKVTTGTIQPLPVPSSGSSTYVTAAKNTSYGTSGSNSSVSYDPSLYGSSTTTTTTATTRTSTTASTTMDMTDAFYHPTGASVYTSDNGSTATFEYNTDIEPILLSENETLEDLYAGRLGERSRRVGAVPSGAVVITSHESMTFDSVSSTEVAGTFDTTVSSGQIIGSIDALDLDETSTIEMIASDTTSATPSSTFNAEGLFEAAQPRDGEFVVFFGFNDSNITDESEDILIDVVTEAISRNAQKITLYGHADSSGNASYNKGLAGRRANNVGSYLKTQLANGVDVQVLSMGENSQAVAVGDNVEEALNRRVEIAIE